MSTRTYQTVDVPVQGGAVRVGVWDVGTADAPDAPDAAGAPGAPTVVLVHGVTSSHLAFAFSSSTSQKCVSSRRTCGVEAAATP